MEQSKEGQRLAATAKGAKLRKRLQKNVPYQQTPLACRRGSGTSSQTLTSSKSDPTVNRSAGPAHRRPSPLAFPDARDLTRSLFCRKDAASHPHKPPSDPEERLGRPIIHMVPVNPHSVFDEPQWQPSPSISPSTMRTDGKTPIVSTESVENLPRPVSPDSPPGRTSSVELIAEQYQTLLEARRFSAQADPFSEPPPSPPSSDDDEQASSDGSPTLLSFRDEAVYFKPVSYPDAEADAEPPFPPPPLPTQPSTAETLLADGAVDSDGNGNGNNVSLQICLDLLTRELSSAMLPPADRATLGSPRMDGTSALQVWTMIEAYEQLRDGLRVVGRRRSPDGGEELRAVEAMFDVWLRALYRIHDSLEGGDGQASESDWWCWRGDG